MKTPPTDKTDLELDDFKKDLMLLFDKAFDISEDLTGVRFNNGDIDNKRYKAYRERCVKPVLETAQALINSLIADELEQIYDHINTGNVYLGLGKIKDRIKELRNA